MKRIISRVISLALAAALTAAMSVAAMADCTTGGCKQCESEGLTFTGLYATAEYAKRAKLGTLKTEDMVPKEIEEEE